MTVSQGILWQVLLDHGEPGMLLMPFWSLFAQSNSFVCILEMKASLFKEAVGLYQGCYFFLLILFVVFVENILNCYGKNGVWFGNVRFSSSHFADDVLPLTSWHHDLQDALEQCGAECDGARRRATTSKEESYHI